MDNEVSGKQLEAKITEKPWFPSSGPDEP